MPSLYLITSLGLSDFLDYYLKKETAKQIGRGVVLFAILFMLFQFHQKTIMILNSNRTILTGYDEAAQWIKKHTAEATIIISESPRVLRYFSGINFQKYGGKIIKLPWTKKAFETLVVKGPIILDVTVWNELQKDEFPSFFNFPKEKEYFNHLQFHLEKVIYRNVYLNKTQHAIIPVIRIYQRNP